MKKTLYIFYALMPFLSVAGVLGVSWILAAFLEVFTNNLTMVKILNPYPSRVQQKGSGHLNKDTGFYPGNNKNNIFWFVQISDLHFSKYRDYGQLNDMRTFCKTTLKMIDPAFVIVTGDLTDAKDPTLLSSQQYEVEWKTYASIMDECKKTTSQWLDVRGNHDSFKVPHLSDHENYFEKYASSKNNYKETGIFPYIHRTGYGSYAFIGVDFAPDPGPGRPFNFFGIPSQKTITAMETVSRELYKHNASIWYGHYPLSVTTDPHHLRKLISSGVAYLCGHLHTFLGWVPTMHAVHDEGFLELELGDWKENRRYRVGAFDHDVFSFVDVIYSERPVVMVTNPPAAKYVANKNTASWKALESTHIRFLLFNIDSVVHIHISINNDVICKQTTQILDPFFTCPWTPSLYSKGVHKMVIKLKRSDGRQMVHQHVFSLDGTRPPLGLRTVILLLTDFCTMCRIVFLVTVFWTIVLPILLKKCSFKRQIVLLRELLHVLLPQLANFFECDHVFWLVIAYNVFITIGPNSIGYFVPDGIGVQFAYGIFTGGNFLPGTLTFLYTSSQLLLFNMVVPIYLGERLQTYKLKLKFPLLRTCLFHAIFFSFIAFELSSSYMYWVAYGKLSFLINPVRTWSVPFAFYLVKQVSTKIRK